jgi:hypothetical protein
MDEHTPEIEMSKDHFRLKGEKAEGVVHDLARGTFLTDWCYLNPKLPDGNELCDLLVVFDDVAIIWQIKDLKLNDRGQYNIGDVDKNLRQLSGARRQLFELRTKIELQNPRRGKEQFDPSQIKQVYLISVLFGEGEDVFSFIDAIKGYTVHVLTKDFTEINLAELDTMSDFVTYLRAKEKLVTKEKTIVIAGGEEELLAFYLLNNRNFERFNAADHITITQGSWEHLNKKPEYLAKKRADKISYYWDSIINRAHEGGGEYEVVAREMARFNRFQRRGLSKVMYEGCVQAHRDEEHDLVRRLVSTLEVTVCFLFQDDPEPHGRRRAELEAMCFVARGIIQDNRKVLGIATEKKIRPECTYDFCFLDIPEWTEQDQRGMEQLQMETGIFVSPEIAHMKEREYPGESEGDGETEGRH